MGRSSRTLDTPFDKGEVVVTTQPVGPHPAGAHGKIKMSNGLGEWRRYWVRFTDNNELVGQIDHASLVRPNQVELWEQRERERELAAQKAESTEIEAETTAASTGSAGGIASQIPAALLERSKAAKKRLLG